MRMINMKLEDFIEVVNRCIEERIPKESPLKQHLVLQRAILPNPTFKAFKTYILTLWVVDRDGNRKSLIGTQSQIKSSSSTEEQDIKDLEQLFLLSLLNTLISGKSPKSEKTILEELAHGEFTGYVDE